MKYDSGEYQSAFELLHEFGDELFDNNFEIVNHAGSKELTKFYRYDSEVNDLESSIQIRNIFITVFTFVLLILLLIYYRIKIANNKIQLQNTLLSYDLLSQELKEAKTGVLSHINSDIITHYESQLHLINELIEQCVKLGQSNESTSVEILRKRIDTLLLNINSDENHSTLASVIDQCDNNWMTRFKQEYPNLPPNDYKLATYLYLKFSPGIICILLGKKSTDSMRSMKYNFKIRLKKPHRRIRTKSSTNWV